MTMLTGKSDESILEEAAPLPPALSVFVRAFVLRSRQLRIIEAAGVAVAFILIWTLSWSLVDRFLPMPRWFRGLLLLIEAGAAIMVLVRPALRLLSGHIPWHQAAAAIEERDPQFGGRLQTALSQSLMPANQRGSASLLAQVIEETSTKVRLADVRSLLPSLKAFRSAGIATAVLMLMCGLLAVSWLNLPRLLKRELFPFLNAAPVTTTRLFVSPGSVTVIEGDSLKVTVRAERLGDSQPLLQWRGEDPVYSSAVMLAEPGGFSYTFPSIDRALSYRVTGGDAASALFDVHLTNRPTVRQIRVSYVYPDWTELPPKLSAVATGDLEAPVGSIATVSVTASEAVSSAVCLFAGKRIESAPSVDPAVRLFTIPLQSSGPWRLELTDANGITGSGPSGLTIHALPAEPPQVTLRIPTSDEELRLHPRDVLTLAYEVADKFALSKIFASIDVDSTPPVIISIPLGANHRLQSGSFDIDLAQLAVNLGDIVTVTLTAENKAGLHGTSIPCRIVVSPRSIDLNAQQRLSELRSAQRLAKLLNDEATAAAKALDQSPVGDDKENRDEQIAPHLAVADGITPDLSRQLLRAVTHTGSVDLSNALVWMVDATQRAASGFEAADGVLLTEMRDPLRGKLSNLVGVTNELQQSLDAFCRGEYAAQILAEAEDAKADEARIGSLAGAKADAVRQSVQRANTKEATACGELAIDPNAADRETQLKQRVDQAADVARRYGMIDFAAIAGEWSAAGPDDGKGFVARLTVGSQAEAVRPAGDFIWARDLQLSARAARRIDTSADEPANSRKDYPGALRSLQQAHVLLIARTPFLQMAQPIKDADDARRRMRLWAGETDAIAQPKASPGAIDPERTALETAAAEAQQKLDQNSRLEHATATTMEGDTASFLALPPTPSGGSPPTSELPASPEEQNQLKQTVATARRLERLTAEQRILRRQTAKATDAQMPDLAKEQAALTDAIQNAKPEEAQRDSAQSDSPTDDQPKDSRESAMNAIRSAQERLMDMPKEIEHASQAEEKQHDAADLADKAQHDAETSDPETKEAAQQIAQESHAASDAAKAQASAAQVSPDEAANIAAALQKFAPEATPAVEEIEQQLTPALAAMRQTQAAQDHSGNQHAAEQATQAVAEAQRRLNDGLQSLLKRDALTTAKFFSSKAAQAMAGPTPDRAAAVKLQRGASAALEQAWDDALHQAAGQRLARMPSMAAILRLNSVEGDAGSENVLGVEPAPAEREWGHLRAQRPDDLSAVSREIDPPEYQDALRVYFKDLAAKDGGTRR